MVVANVTQPANFFHLLRRQVTWPFRKPCIVMSPKSMLRHPLAVSPLEEFTKGTFREVIDDEAVTPKAPSGCCCARASYTTNCWKSGRSRGAPT
jgi:2-oxoglutarate dehydrogenase E1 component